MKGHLLPLVVPFNGSAGKFCTVFYALLFELTVTERVRQSKDHSYRMHR